MESSNSDGHRNMDEKTSNILVNTVLVYGVTPMALERLGLV